MDIVQFAIGNLFINIFLAIIVAGAQLQGAAAFDTTGHQMSDSTAIARMHAILDDRTSKTGNYSACPSGSGCEGPSQTQNANAFDPILVLYNFASIIGKVISFIALSLYQYMTWGFFSGLSDSPVIFIGLIIMAWNLTSWYLFTRFVLGGTTTRFR